MRASGGHLNWHAKHANMVTGGHKEGKNEGKPETVRMPFFESKLKLSNADFWFSGARRSDLQNWRTLEKASGSTPSDWQQHSQTGWSPPSPSKGENIIQHSNLIFGGSNFVAHGNTGSISILPGCLKLGPEWYLAAQQWARAWQGGGWKRRKYNVVRDE